MKIFEINGGTPLFGTVETSGSKNITLAVMAGALLCKGVTTLKNVPNITDVHNMAKVTQSLGVECTFQENNTLIIDATEIKGELAEYKYVSKIRAGFNVLGPVLARQGHAAVSRPGGCNIGDRPVNLHILALKKLGAREIEATDKVEMVHNGLKGTTISFDTVTVGGTQHAVTGAVLAEGETKIINASIEPEVTCLIDFLKNCGAEIKIDEQKSIIINGVKELKGITYDIPFDRIEAGTYASFAAITKADITIEKVNPNHMEAFLYKMEEIGVKVTTEEDRIRFQAENRLKAANLSTGVFPGFPTDLQPAYSTLMTVAEGVSRINENIFNGRFKFLSELQRMGANCDYTAHNAIITGVEKLNCAELESPDLRGGTALICAALSAKGVSKIHDPNGFILRGYENIVEKITNIKGEIKIIDDTEEPVSEIPSVTKPVSDNPDNSNVPENINSDTKNTNNTEV
ncbi:MAG: UDP-N-acetylglucosamine 1-carboxyvinyltransferase [Armatimonadetes bacterium]|nr:UDP-N-acetylglucosamine 1-carboxyvinyltransferase [Candidatus Hippobium faecium]